MFKEYRYFEKNDGNVKGAINISRHISRNNPFRGTIAYRVREFSYDNRITQLIRHTIEFIQEKSWAKPILKNDQDTIAAVSQIIEITPSYSRLSRQRVVAQNLRQISHPYYLKYRSLQRLCLQILRYEKISYGDDDNQVYGILFDGAWLWEEYLATFLAGHGKFIHPKNKTRQGGIRPFEKETDSLFWYPDFHQEKFILDAKYKRLDNGISSRDLQQIIAYMHITNSKTGAFIHPCGTATQAHHRGALRGREENIMRFSVNIPQGICNYFDFCKAMEASETHVQGLINSNINLKTKTVIADQL